MKQIKIILTITFVFFSALLQAAEVNVYSARKEALIKPLLDRFTDETGIQVNLITGKADALIKRMEVEGQYSPADVLITVDAARLYRASQLGLFAALDDSLLNKVRADYRDENKKWIGLSLRSRVIVYAKDRVQPESLSSYENLAGSEWQKKLCVRSSDNIYNQSLVASLIAHLGAEQTGVWLKGLVDNFARSPKGGDRDQIKAVAAGQCDLALVNTYYVGGMLDSSIASEREAVEKVAVFWPNQADRGAHINLSGIGMTNSAKNTEQAHSLIEFLLKPESQAWYAETNYEYPVVDGINNNNLESLWGPFKPESINMGLLGQHNAEAVILMDKAGWK